MPVSDLSAIAISDVHDAYDRRRVGKWSDRALGAAVGAVVARPKVALADSFLLHAPLELLARFCLLARVEPSTRDSVRRRLVWLAATYEAAGEELPDPAALDSSLSVEDVGARLVAALEAGDLDDIDGYSASLGERATPTMLRQLLAAPVAASLAAAAHGSIFLALFPRVQAASGIPGGVLRGLTRDLGRHPDWKLRWFEDPDEPDVSGSLADALLEVPMLGPAGNNFIMPVMRQAEDSGIAAKLLSGVIDGGAVDVPLVRAQLSRIAAWSMLQEPSSHAYGWTHCLTMPQAVMALAADALDARSAVAIAATHVVGFRAANGQRSLVPLFDPAPPGAADLEEAIAGGPDVAASYAWFAAAEPASVAALEASLASRAACHHDAHYAKYTLACFDAAEADPAQQPLYFATAAFLAGYWAHMGDDGFLAA